MEALNISSDTIDKLKQFKDIKKFLPSGMYPGAPSESIRSKCEEGINQMVSELIENLSDNPNKSYVLAVFKKHLEKFDLEDTEEREQAAFNCEKVMDILGIESSDGVLNTWMYGFD